MNMQLKKGVIEMCVLAILSRQDCYGYELVSLISEKVGIAEGTIYPLLKRIKDSGYVTTYLLESSEGPPRKYYHMSNIGKDFTAEAIKEWQELSNGVNYILQGGNDDEQE